MSELEAKTDHGKTTIEVADGVATVTLDYPARRNAFSPQLKKSLIEGLSALVKEPKCRVIILTGAGGNFSAGGDINGMMTLTGLDGRDRLLEMQQMVRLVTEAEKPVIAAVEGFAAGGGMALAAACDIVVAARDAKFTCAFSKIGLMPDLGAVWTLPMRMGLGRARYFMLAGEPMGAEEALGAGLVEKVVRPGEALTEARKLAAGFAISATRALGFTKSVLARMPASLDAMLKAEADAQVGLLISEDFREGRAAFMEKRPARFVGQ